MISPRLKLLLMLAATTWMLVFPDLLTVAAFAAASASLLFAFGVQGKFAQWLKPLALVAASVILVQSFASSWPAFSADGFVRGVLYAARISTLLMLVSLFIHTTSTSGLGEAFGFLPGHLKTVLLMSLAMLPRLTSLAQSILNAQRCRGLSFRSPNISRTYFPLLVPLFGKALDQSERMGYAMLSRGYGARATRQSRGGR